MTMMTEPPAGREEGAALPERAGSEEIADYALTWAVRRAVTGSETTPAPG
jgi:hypothetical protein